MKSNHWLKDRQFDVLHFTDWRALGYYSLLARSQSVAFQDTIMCLSVTGPSNWIREQECAFPMRLEDLIVDFMERESVRLADVVVAPDENILEWMSSRGFSLPYKTFVEPFLAAPANPADRLRPVTHTRSSNLNCAPDTSAKESYPARQEPNAKRWVDWHSQLEPPSSSPRQCAGELPHISVCIALTGASGSHREVVDSLKSQEYKNLELIVVDCGVLDSEATRQLDADIELIGGRLLNIESNTVSQAYDAAAEVARGQYLLLMDDRTVVKPHELSTFARVAKLVGADILTCPVDYSSPDSELASERRLYLGPAASVGLFCNPFGDTRSLIRKRGVPEAGWLYRYW